MDDILPVDVENIITLIQDIKNCQDCELSKSATRKAIESGIILTEYSDINTVIIGMAPGQCEDLCGIPLVGYHELGSSQCLMCKEFYECFGYFLNKKDEYKKDHKGCIYKDQLPAAVSEKEYKERLSNIKLEMLTKNGKVSVRTAGQILDLWCGYAGLIRPSMYDFSNYRGTSCEAPNCTTMNAVQCRVTSSDGKNNGVPDKKQIKSCQRHIVKLLEVLPEVRLIIAVGAQALYSLIEEEIPVLKNKNGLFIYKNIPIVYYPHPSYYLRQLTSARNLDERVSVNKEIKEIAEQIKKRVLEFVPKENIRKSVINTFPSL
jgi:uracil-DNA glycosylase family 4